MTCVMSSNDWTVKNA